MNTASDPDCVLEPSVGVGIRGCRAGLSTARNDLTSISVSRERPENDGKILATGIPTKSRLPLGRIRLRCRNLHDVIIWAPRYPGTIPFGDNPWCSGPEFTGDKTWPRSTEGNTQLRFFPKASSVLCATMEGRHRGVWYGDGTLTGRNGPSTADGLDNAAEDDVYGRC